MSTTTANPCTIERFTASDGYEWRYRLYPGHGPRRGQVVGIHGIQSHGGWYTASCEYLAREGWEVAFLDRRGSGLNQQARGDAPGFRRLVADLDEFVTARCERPPFLLAISWGGKLAVALEQFAPGRTAGLMLLAPGLRARVRPTLGQRLRILMSRLVNPGRRFRIPLDDPRLFTDSPRWQEFIRNDPLSLREATARFLVSSVHLDVVIRRAPPRVRVPLLLLLAGQDRIIENSRTRDYVERFASRDRQVIEYPHAHHTLEFEPDPTPVFRDLAGWLERHG